MTRRTNGEGTIHRDSERGGWVGQLTVDGRRRKVRGKTKIDAAAKLGALKHNASLGLAAADGNATVTQLLTLWRDRVLTNRTLAPATIDNYLWACGVLDGQIGTVRLRSLDVTMVEHAIDTIATGKVDGCRGKPLSRRTLKMARATLVQVLDFAVKRRMIAYNPAAMAELTASAPKGKPRRSLNVDEAAKLWNAFTGERLGNLFKVMLSTGLRVGEAAGICDDAIDLDDGLLNVRRAVRVERGRARLVDEVKTAHAFRTIRLPEPAIEALRDQRRTRAALKLAAAVWAVDDPGLLFPTSTGRPWDTSNVRDELTIACAKAGIPRIVPHELRHSAASLLNDQGVPLELIADLLGHADVTMLARVYRHRLRPSADAAVAPMNKMFGGTS